MNGHSSTAQCTVITLLVGTWQVIPLLSGGITLYLVCWLRDRVFPGALSQMEGPIFLRFLPLGHSISQRFTVVLLRDLKWAAVVEQVGGVIAGLPSLQVSLFRNGVGGIRMVCSHRLFSYLFLLATKNCFGVCFYFTLLCQMLYLCSEDGSCCYYSTANICLDTRSTSHSLSFTHSARCKPKFNFWLLILEQLETTLFFIALHSAFPIF